MGYYGRVLALGEMLIYPAAMEETRLYAFRLFSTNPNANIEQTLDSLSSILSQTNFCLVIEGLYNTNT